MRYLNLTVVPDGSEASIANYIPQEGAVSPEEIRAWLEPDARSDVSPLTRNFHDGQSYDIFFTVP